MAVSIPGSCVRIAAGRCDYAVGYHNIPVAVDAGTPCASAAACGGAACSFNRAAGDDQIIVSLDTVAVSSPISCCRLTAGRCYRAAGDDHTIVALNAPASCIIAADRASRSFHCGVGDHNVAVSADTYTFNEDYRVLACNIAAAYIQAAAAGDGKFSFFCKNTITAECISLPTAV